MYDRTAIIDNDSNTLVSQGDSVEEFARHGFEHDEQFLTMLQQVFFMYYNVRISLQPQQRPNSDEDLG